MMVLTGQVALITGGARRIGREIAMELAHGGASIVISTLSSAAAARRTVANIRRNGGRAMAIRGDLSRGHTIRRLIRTVIAKFGRIDILVNNAAIFEKTPWGRLTERSWDRHMDINLKAPFLCALEAGRAMLRQGSGVIINIADRTATRPHPGYLPYSISKAGVIALTQSLAVELAPTVRVNCIAPGSILFPKGYSARVKRRLIQTIPLQRTGSPSDIARGVRFLIETDFATGSVLVIDGGQSLA